MCCFPTSIKFTLMSLKNTMGWLTVTGLGHRLLLWDESLLAFFWVTGTICPSSWGKAGWSEWSSAMLFRFLFGIPDLASVAVWWGGWFGMTCFVLCSAAKLGHNLLWLTYCIAGDMFCCRADGFRMNVFAISASYWARCCLLLSPLPRSEAWFSFQHPIKT